MTIWSGAQWAVTDKVVKTIDGTRYDFEVKRLAEVEDFGHGPVYSWFPHLAEKNWFDLDDFIEAFHEGWSAHQSKLGGPVDGAMLERSIRQARKLRKQLFEDVRVDF